MATPLEIDIRTWKKLAIGAKSRRLSQQTLRIFARDLLAHIDSCPAIQHRFVPEVFVPDKNGEVRFVVEIYYRPDDEPAMEVWWDAEIMKQLWQGIQEVKGDFACAQVKPDENGWNPDTQKLLEILQPRVGPTK